MTAPHFLILRKQKFYFTFNDGLFRCKAHDNSQVENSRCRPSYVIHRHSDLQNDAANGYKMIHSWTFSSGKTSGCDVDWHWFSATVAAFFSRHNVSVGIPSRSWRELWAHAFGLGHAVSKASDNKTEPALCDPVNRTHSCSSEKVYVKNVYTGIGAEVKFLVLCAFYLLSTSQVRFSVEFCACFPRVCNGFPLGTSVFLYSPKIWPFSPISHDVFLSDVERWRVQSNRCHLGMMQDFQFIRFTRCVDLCCQKLRLRWVSQGQKRYTFTQRVPALASRYLARVWLTLSVSHF